MRQFACGTTLLFSMASVALAEDTRLPSTTLTRGERVAMAVSALDLGISFREVFRPRGAYRIGGLWDSSKVTVCWRDPGNPSEEIRKVVQSAIADSWSKHANIRFVGWGNCGDSLAPDIRLQAAKTASMTYGVGKDLRKKNPGMLLRIDYSDVPECQAKDAASPRYCLRANATHEFGHALGLTHENLRPDAPNWCHEYQLKGDDNSPKPDGTVGKADLFSIMNYCNPTSLNNGNLSAGDIETIKKLYSGL